MKSSKNWLGIIEIFAFKDTCQSLMIDLQA